MLRQSAKNAVSNALGVASLVAVTAISLEAAGDICTEPTDPEGLRSCDVVDFACPFVGSLPFAADHASVWEAGPYLQNLDEDIDDGQGDDDYLEVIELGSSWKLDMGIDAAALDGVEHWEAPLLAARLTAGADLQGVDKPAVLFACGVHAHEWIPQETCLGYVDWVVKAANGYAFLQ